MLLVLSKVSFQRCSYRHLGRILRLGFRIDDKVEETWGQFLWWRCTHAQIQVVLSYQINYFVISMLLQNYALPICPLVIISINYNSLTLFPRGKNMWVISFCFVFAVGAHLEVRLSLGSFCVGCVRVKSYAKLTANWQVGLYIHRLVIGPIQGEGLFFNNFKSIQDWCCCNLQLQLIIRKRIMGLNLTAMSCCYKCL